jgi:hypothetical protein
MAVTVKVFSDIQAEFNVKNTTRGKLSVIKAYNTHLKIILDNDCTWCEFQKPKSMGTQTFDKILEEINYKGLNLPYLGHGGEIEEVFALSGIHAEGC